MTDLFFAIQSSSTTLPGQQCVGYGWHVKLGYTIYLSIVRTVYFLEIRAKK
jgi:hypothetical protein